MTATQTTERCPVWDDIEQCANDGTHHVQVGCVHEHVDTYQVCQHHLGRLTGRALSCRTCGTGEGAHHCPVAGREVKP